MCYTCVSAGELQWRYCPRCGMALRMPDARDDMTQGGLARFDPKYELVEKVASPPRPAPDESEVDVLLAEVAVRITPLFDEGTWALRRLENYWSLSGRQSGLWNEATGKTFREIFEKAARQGISAMRVAAFGKFGVAAPREVTEIPTDEKGKSIL